MNSLGLGIFYQKRKMIFNDLLVHWSGRCQYNIMSAQIFNELHKQFHRRLYTIAPGSSRWKKHSCTVRNRRIRRDEATEFCIVFSEVDLFHQGIRVEKNREHILVPEFRFIKRGPFKLV